MSLTNQYCMFRFSIAMRFISSSLVNIYVQNVEYTLLDITTGIQCQRCHIDSKKVM